MVDTKTLNKYKCVLASFMSFIHGRSDGDKYARDCVHSMEALAAVTPQDVVRYMNLKTFGTLIPAPDANHYLGVEQLWDSTRRRYLFSCQIERNGV